MFLVKRLVKVFADCPLYEATGICSFTPVLVAILVILGLGAVTGYLDAVLLPGLAVLLSLMLYGLPR
jgi:hypothetical protein